MELSKSQSQLENRESSNIVLEKDSILDSFKKKLNGVDESIELQHLYNSVVNIQLNQNIPLEVKQVFEISKRLYVHGYFYCQFFTVSQHYAFLALESALKNRYIQIFGKNEEDLNLKEVIDRLAEKGIILENEKSLYDSGRFLRNELSHLAERKILFPSAKILENVKDLINKIYN